MAGQTYRVITRKLRVQRGPGNADLVVARPMRQGKDGTYVFTDSDAAPTLVTFDALCRVDAPSLLAIGAIAEHVPAGTAPAPSPSPRGRGDDGVKERSHG